MLAIRQCLDPFPELEGGRASNPPSCRGHAPHHRPRACSAFPAADEELLRSSWSFHFIITSFRCGQIKTGASHPPTGLPSPMNPASSRRQAPPGEEAKELHHAAGDEQNTVSLCPSKSCSVTTQHALEVDMYHNVTSATLLQTSIASCVWELQGRSCCATHFSLLRRHSSLCPARTLHDPSAASLSARSSPMSLG